MKKKGSPFFFGHAEGVLPAPAEGVRTALAEGVLLALAEGVLLALAEGVLLARQKEAKQLYSVRWHS